MRPWPSVMARACGTALSCPRSEVPPPLLNQWPIDAICGTPFMMNWARNSGWSGGRSTTGYCAGGSALASCSAHTSQAYSPQKSSAQRKPPLSM